MMSEGLLRKIPLNLENKDNFDAEKVIILQNFTWLHFYTFTTCPDSGANDGLNICGHT